MSAPGSDYYQISCPPVEQDRLRTWMEQARSTGLGDEFRTAVNDVIHYLRTDPLNWGDPLYRHPHLGLLCCRGLSPALYVYYAIDEARRIVYIQRFSLRPGYALEENS